MGTDVDVVVVETVVVIVVDVVVVVSVMMVAHGLQGPPQSIPSSP